MMKKLSPEEAHVLIAAAGLLLGAFFGHRPHQDATRSSTLRKPAQSTKPDIGSRVYEYTPKTLHPGALRERPEKSYIGNAVESLVRGTAGHASAQANPALIFHPDQACRTTCRMLLKTGSRVSWN
jgi:hypothetical protein